MKPEFEPALESDRLLTRGNLYASQGDMQRAMALYEQALAIARKLGGWHGRKSEAAALAALGLSRRLLGDARGAIELLEQALVIERELADAKVGDPSTI